MKKSILCLACIAIMSSGCSSFGTKAPAPIIKVENKLEQKPDIKKAEAEFLEANGSLQLQFSEDGEWLVIKTTGTAPINFNHPQGHEDAFMLAGMRAKRNLIEFLNNDVKSTKTAENITKTSLRDLVSVKNTEQRNPDVKKNDEDDSQGVDTYSEEDRRRASRISQNVTESIRDSSQGIIKGAYIASRRIDRDSNMVTVVLVVSKKTINTSANVRKMMNGF
jgi:hypothetical protein